MWETMDQHLQEQAVCYCNTVLSICRMNVADTSGAW